MKDGKVIRNSHHGFIKEKLGLTNLITFCSEVTSMVDEVKVVGVVCLSFSKSFDTVTTLS